MYLSSASFVVNSHTNHHHLPTKHHNQCAWPKNHTPSWTDFSWEVKPTTTWMVSKEGKGRRRNKHRNSLKFFKNCWVHKKFDGCMKQFPRQSYVRGVARCTQQYCWCTQHFFLMPKMPLACCSFLICFFWLSGDP